MKRRNPARKISVTDILKALRAQQLYERLLVREL
jgi:hypothetical protein